MKNYFVILPLVALITACGTTKDDYQKRAEAAEEKREAQVSKSISRSPSWMTELPTSDSAVFANGSAVSTDMSMADYKAKLFAFGKICMAAGGKVSQQAKVFMQDTTEASMEISELAIKSGADFIKTSTGKTKISATPEAVTTMLQVIRDSERPVGLKPSGGIRAIADAQQYLDLADAIMGPQWATPHTFRFGASGLLDAVEAELRS
jgi:predicted acylesterase/phospholipase RssA